MHLSGTPKLVICAALIVIFAVSAFSQMTRDATTEFSLNSERHIASGLSEGQVLGRVTDFAGRSVRSARITLFCLDTDQVHQVSTNAFGYYQFKTLIEGHNYLVSIDHPRHLFLAGSISVTIAEDPIEIDFRAERRH